jgi:hypothetical protein
VKQYLSAKIGRRSIFLLATLLMVILITSTIVFSETNSDYITIGWNELGMHCISPRFKEMAILPPYNNLVVQVIKRGNPPTLVTSGFTVEYSIINNTTVVGKTDFWKYAKQLFGVNLPVGMGLTGNGLSGTMQPAGDRFIATGIPVLPYDDNMTWNPYQVAVVTLKNASGRKLYTSNVVLPVSDEMHCNKCHASGRIAAVGINTGTVDGNILMLHDKREGTKLMASRPVLCASCHSDNALGTPGNPGVKSLSLAMHGKHATLGKTMPGCYDCHPGKNTQCNRSAIDSMGPEGNNPNCERCHGNLQQVAISLQRGRSPWLQEPTCAQCHGASVTTNEPLYRDSAGHGGVACAACHNSPHAWWPSLNSVDNSQPIKLQGSADSIQECSICHVGDPGGDMSHTSH